MKIFTVEEANNLLPEIVPQLIKLRDCHRNIVAWRESAQAAAESAPFGGGGMEGGSIYVSSIYEFNQLIAELDALEIQIKDYSRGLIDFPAMHEDRLVLLCWKLGEIAEIQWWHDLEAGFAGRQRI